MYAPAYAPALVMLNRSSVLQFSLGESVYSVTSDLCSFLALWMWFLLPFPTMASLAASHADAHAELGQTRTARVRCVSAARPSRLQPCRRCRHFHLRRPSFSLPQVLHRGRGGLRQAAGCKSRSAWAITARGKAKGSANTGSRGRCKTREWVTAGPIESVSLGIINSPDKLRRMWVALEKMDESLRLSGRRARNHLGCQKTFFR